MIAGQFDALRHLRGDAAWLERAVHNLVGNAVQHAGGPGEVVVEARLDGDTVQLDVSNPGEIPAALRPRLFERFVSKDKGGSGLGLAIVRSVAEAHGGGAAVIDAGPPRVTVRMWIPL